jgi:23S rRNA (uracil1939-C5)-methyltransferase
MVRCDRVVHGGLCIAALDDGGTVLVAGAIPGELVEAELRYRKGKTWFADTVTAVEASPHRVSAPCPYVPDCGGCQLQHVAYAEQLELKRAIVVDALRREGVRAPEPLRVIGMDEPWRYRWRGEFHIVPGERGVPDAGLGFNRARSWRPIAVDDCLIHHRGITDALPALRGMVHEGGSDALTALHLTLGDAGRELLVRAKPQRALDPHAVDDASMHMPDGGRISTDSTSLSWRGHTYRVTPDAFIQVNVDQMEALYAAVIAGLSTHQGKRVVDAYAGIGILATHLAAEGSDVVCIENNRAAARIGVLNARVNDVSDRVRYILAPVEEALPRLAAEAHVDQLILDPPRAGCGGSVTAWIALAGPERVVYVSCDPATLARDLHVLVASGPYVLEDLVIVDMFPQTYHVECVVTLRRG